jgi:hypothetical protein
VARCRLLHGVLAHCRAGQEGGGGAGGYELPLEELEYSTKECFDCHAHGSYEEVTARTEDCIIGEESVNPHDPQRGQMRGR